MDKFSKIIIASAVAVNVYDGEQLNLTRISRTEMGAYLCIATNGVPPSVSKRIIVDVECKYTKSFMCLFILIHSKNEIFFDASKKCHGQTFWRILPNSTFLVLCSCCAVTFSLYYSLFSRFWQGQTCASLRALAGSPFISTGIAANWMYTRAETWMNY